LEKDKDTSKLKKKKLLIFSYQSDHLALLLAIKQIQQTCETSTQQRVSSEHISHPNRHVRQAHSRESVL